MSNDDAIYLFTGLKQMLSNMGYHIEKSTAYKPITNPIEVGIKELSESFKFTDEGIFYIDNLGEKRKVYLYKRNYRLEKYGKPRFHICKCQKLDEFILKGNFEREYRASNAEEVPVANMDNNYTEEIVDNLPMCEYCKKIMREKRKIESNDFVKQLKDESFSDNSWNKTSRKVDVDIFGYTRDWEEISQRIREDRNYTCEQCGIHIENLSDRYFMHVHHLNGNKADNRSANLKCLCIRCHSNIDDKHKKNFSRGANKVCLESFNMNYPDNK